MQIQRNLFAAWQRLSGLALVVAACVGMAACEPKPPQPKAGGAAAAAPSVPHADRAVVSPAQPPARAVP